MGRMRTLLDLFGSKRGYSARTMRMPDRSMEPTYRKGQRLATRELFVDEPKIGQVVVVRSPRGWAVGRVSADTIDGFVVAGDNRGETILGEPLPAAAIRRVVSGPI